MTIHDNIDELLAADLHNELSEQERNALHTHLVECADCRKTHQETKTMNNALEEKFENEKPDIAFENRMLAHFRNRIPKRNGLLAVSMALGRFRGIQIAGVVDSNRRGEREFGS